MQTGVYMNIEHTRDMQDTTQIMRKCRNNVFFEVYSIPHAIVNKLQDVCSK